MQETQERWVQSLGWEDPLEKEMATHFSILAWKIAWIEELSRLYSACVVKSQTGLNMCPHTDAHTCMHAHARTHARTQVLLSLFEIHNLSFNSRCPLVSSQHPHSGCGSPVGGGGHPTSALPSPLTYPADKTGSVC